MSGDQINGTQAGSVDPVPTFVAAPIDPVPIIVDPVPDPDPTKKPSRPPSSAWDDFKKVGNKAVCKWCAKCYAGNSTTHGTTNLLKHSAICIKNPNRKRDKKQKTLHLGENKGDEDDTTISFKLVDFNQEKSREDLVKVIILDELPFKFVEN